MKHLRDCHPPPAVRRRACAAPPRHQSGPTRRSTRTHASGATLFRPRPQLPCWASECRDSSRVPCPPF
eukprot:scaffold85753_cov25-Tisochrysis_lutea.AAC.1